MTRFIDRIVNNRSAPVHLCVTLSVIFLVMLAVIK